MTHPLVKQLYFARSEFLRCLEGLTEPDGVRRLEPMNSISWMVGHLANQEHFYWVILPQRKFLAPGLNDRVGTGKPPSTPALAEMLAVWQTVTAGADAFLETLDAAQLTEFQTFNGKPLRESIGTQLQRNIYHYWFHIGEAHAVRQMLGHQDLPQFVGDMTSAVYLPETG
ncbi:MAG: DinB family protein [Anaerolineales bacterium]|jgi:hypothetical protein